MNSWTKSIGARHIGQRILLEHSESERVTDQRIYEMIREESEKKQLNMFK
jgi:hypothetical protein